LSIVRLPILREYFYSISRFVYNLDKGEPFIFAILTVRFWGFLWVSGYVFISLRTLPKGYERAQFSRRELGLSLSKKENLKEDGKEKSYERNPSGVSLVFNQKFSRASEKTGKTCPGWRKFSPA
jgi:hypothetical protein